MKILLLAFWLVAFWPAIVAFRALELIAAGRPLGAVPGDAGLALFLVWIVGAALLFPARTS